MDPQSVVVVRVEGGSEVIRFRPGSATLVLEALSKDPRAGPGSLADKHDIQVLATQEVLTAENGPYLFRRQLAGAGPSSAGGAPAVYTPGALWTPTRLFSCWKMHGVLHRAMPTWVAQEVAEMGERFSAYWDRHSDQLQGLKLTTRLCRAEPDIPCYTSAHTILTEIYKCMVTIPLGQDARWDVDHRIFKAINQMNVQEHGSGAPDMAWGLLGNVVVERGRGGLEWKDHGMIIQELKAQAHDLDAGVAQVVDRGDTIRQRCKGQQSILLGASSTGAVLRSLVVVHKTDGSLQALYQSEELRLAGASTHNPDIMHVNTASDAFKELVWHVFYAAGHHLSAAAEPSDELLPGDVVRVSVAGSGAGGTRSVCNSCISASFRISHRLSHGVGRTGTTYAAAALDTSGTEGPDCQQAVVIKIGPSHADRQLALHLGLSWPAWYQVERELAVRLGSSSFRNMPPLIAGGTVAQCQRGGEAVALRLTGAAVVATQLLGEALVKEGVLPVLPAHEVVTLMECLVLAVQDLQAQGVHHNDINPGNIGVERCSDGTLQAFYLYDLGAAAAEPVTQLLRQESPDVGMEALLSKDRSLVWDLEFGSSAAVSGSRLQPHSDLESLLFCCIRLLGQVLPWSEAAAAGNKEEVMSLREAAARDPYSLPGFASYPAPLQAFAVTLLSGGAPRSANSRAATPMTVMQDVLQQLVRVQ